MGPFHGQVALDVVVRFLEQAARDPAAAEMTDLEARLNRSLLVSVVQHTYPNPHPLN